MQTWACVDEERVPDDDSTLYLMARGEEYVIQVDGRELMTNQQHGSEDALADFACDRLAELDDARVLVGGLGMGFTLAAVLRRIGPSGVACVAELITSVVRWNEAYVGRAAGHPLRDPRTVVHLGSVADLMLAPPAPWSAILLDVDNGPHALTRPINAWLYSDEAIAAAYAALMPGGVLGVWSAADDPSYTARLEAAGFRVELLLFTEDGRPTPDDSGTQVLWMAQRP